MATVHAPFDSHNLVHIHAPFQATGTPSDIDAALEYLFWNSVNIELREPYFQNNAPETTTTTTTTTTSPPVNHVSDTFNTTLRADGILPNVIAFSSDGIFFLVHYHVITSVSSNNFNGLVLPEHEDACNDLDQDTLELWLPETASQLNVVLCAAYGFSCDLYRPSLECLAASLDIMKKYGLSPQTYLAQGTPLFSTFLNYVPLQPIETYAVAALYNLEDLAAVASSYTLTTPIDCIPTHIASQIGARYFYRLFVLHGTRLEALRAMLDVVLYPHTAKPHCSAQNRMITSRAFHLAGMQIFYQATPGLAGAHIQNIMDDLVRSLGCPDCKETVNNRVTEIIRQWVLLKRTI